MALNLVVKNLGSGLPPELQLCHLPDVGSGQETEPLCAYERDR